MWLTKRNPRVALDMPRFVNRFINDFWNDSLSSWANDSTVWSPSVDVKETKDAYEVMADLPGLDKKDINISLQDNVLTVKGERKHEEKKEGEHHYYYERSHGIFCRSFRLPEKVEEKDIKAEYKDGVLRVTLHKSEEAKSRMIEIR